MRIQVEGQTSGHEEKDEGAGDKPMLWALHAQTRSVVHIGYLSREQTGLACQCICYSCNTPLQAVNAGRDASYFLQHNARGQFFRHDHGQQKDDCLKTAARLAALHMFMQLDQIDLPPPKAKGRFQGASGEIYEHTETGSRVRATVRDKRWIDEQKAQITLADGKVILIKLVTDTNVSGHGQFDAVITIQVNDPDVASWSPEKLLQNAVLVDDWLCWDHHWEHHTLIDIANAQALQQAQEWMDVEPEGQALPHDLTLWQKSESLLHSVLKTMLVDIGAIRVPGMSVPVAKRMPDGTVRETVATVEPTTLQLSNVRLEFRMGNQVPDVFCSAKDQGQQLGTFELMIEVAVKHPVNAAKIAKIRESSIACLEIDAGLINAPRRCTKTTLSAALRHDESNKRWIHLPAVQAHIDAAARQLDEQARALQACIDDTTKRDRWAQAQTLADIAALYLQALRKYWGQSAQQWQQITIRHQGLAWTLEELAVFMARKGCPHADAPLMFEHYGVLWSVSTIEQAGLWPNVPFNFLAVVKRMNEGPRTRPFVGLMAMTATVYRAQAMNDGQSPEEIFRVARESLARRETEYARPDTYDRVISAVFPALEECLKHPGATLAKIMQHKVATANATALETVRRERERDAADLHRQAVLEIQRITQEGWLAPNGLSRSIEQCQRYLTGKDRLFRFDTDMLVASAHRARGMGVDAEQWFRQQNPVSAAEVRQIGQVLKAAWLLS